MSQESNPLFDAGILKSVAGGCACGGSKFTYRLPVRISESILPLLLEFGEPAMDFATSHLIRIHTEKYKINGIKRLKDIDFLLKDPDSYEFQEKFEEALVSYVKMIENEQ